jgi:hypothetical protein
MHPYAGKEACNRTHTQRERDRQTHPHAHTHTDSQSDRVRACAWPRCSRPYTPLRLLVYVHMCPSACMKVNRTLIAAQAWKQLQPHVGRTRRQMHHRPFLAQIKTGRHRCRLHTTIKPRPNSIVSRGTHNRVQPQTGPRTILGKKRDTETRKHIEGERCTCPRTHTYTQRERERQTLCLCV